MAQNYTNYKYQEVTPGFILIYPQAFQRTEGSNWTIAVGSGQWAAWYLSETVRGNAITWNVPLDVGTYSLRMMAQYDTDKAISSLYLDGVNIVDFDWYAATASNAMQTVTGLPITSPGYKLLRLSNYEKNASSSAWGLVINGIALWRTA